MTALVRVCPIIILAAILAACSGPPTVVLPAPTPTPIIPPPAPLPAPLPLPTVGNATLTWTAPTTNTDGSALTDLAGYIVEYGTIAGAPDQTVQVGVGLQTYVIDNLPLGVWYFDVKAVNSADVQSAPSEIVNKKI